MQKQRQRQSLLAGVLGRQAPEPHLQMRIFQDRWSRRQRRRLLARARACACAPTDWGDGGRWPVCQRARACALACQCDRGGGMPASGPVPPRSYEAFGGGEGGGGPGVCAAQAQAGGVASGQEGEGPRRQEEPEGAC